MNYPKCPTCCQRIEAITGYCGCSIRPCDPTPAELAAIRGLRPVDDSLSEVDREIAARLVTPDVPVEEYRPCDMPFLETESEHVCCNGCDCVLNAMVFLVAPFAHTSKSSSRGKSDKHRTGKQAEPTRSSSGRAGKNVSDG